MPKRLRGFTAGTEPDDHGLGRSRGGFTTKIPLACEQGQRPLKMVGMSNTTTTCTGVAHSLSIGELWLPGSHCDHPLISPLLLRHSSKAMPAGRRTRPHSLGVAGYGGRDGVLPHARSRSP